MVNREEIRSRLEILEHAAQQILQGDAAFYEAVRALEREIDSDPGVQLAVRHLQIAGHRVLRSFIPQIKTRIKTEEGVFTLREPSTGPLVPAAGHVARLMQQLKNAASVVVMKSRYRRELELIVNRAVAANDYFEGIASKAHSAGHEVFISLDLSTYSQVQEETKRRNTPGRGDVSEGRLKHLLSDYDVRFLKALKINAE
jgi:hypothetical protein